MPLLDCGVPKVSPAHFQSLGEFVTFDRLQIITVQDILDGARMNLPTHEVTKKAKSSASASQNALFD
jgi:hypothetical protein